MIGFFESNVEKIFKEVGLTKEQAPDMFLQAQEILSAKMAILSSSMGLSYKRIELFSEQELSLIEDLKKMKDAGTLR